MKLSRYTFLFTIEKLFYIYNSLSNALIEIDSVFYIALKKSQIEKIEIDETYFGDKEFLDLLLEKRYIVEDNKDEFILYKSIIYSYRNSNDQLNLTIAPTMDCNYSCPYCFEKKEKTYISSDVIDSIIKYIVSNNESKSLNLTWFGGEPLMAIGKMKEFYDKFRLVWDKGYTSNIITNGFFISQETISILKDIEIRSIQITLDGNKISHNKMKFTEKCSDTFSKTIQNIDLILDTAPDIHVTIRVNLDKNNSGEYSELFYFITNRYSGKSNIGISPAFIQNRSDNCCNTFGNSLFNRKEQSEFILNLFNKNGIHTPFSQYPEPFFSECAMRNKNVIAVDPEGFAYKCWEVIGNKKHAIAKLKNGRLENVDLIKQNRYLFGGDPLENKRCSDCSYLPICNGGCPFQRIENEFCNKNNNTCTHLKGYLPEFLKIHLALKKKLCINR